MACSSSCPTQDHASFGECLRSKNLKVAYCQDWKGYDFTAQKRADSELDLYEKARREGIQPRSTRRAAVEHAIKVSDKTGEAFQA